MVRTPYSRQVLEHLFEITQFTHIFTETSQCLLTILMLILNSIIRTRPLCYTLKDTIMLINASTMSSIS